MSTQEQSTNHTPKWSLVVMLGALILAIAGIAATAFVGWLTNAGDHIPIAFNGLLAADLLFGIIAGLAACHHYTQRQAHERAVWLDERAAARSSQAQELIKALVAKRTKELGRSLSTLDVQMMGLNSKLDAVLEEQRAHRRWEEINGSEPGLRAVKP